MTHRSRLPVLKKNGPPLRRLRLATALLVVSFAALMIAAALYHLTERYTNAVDNALRAARNAAGTVEAHATRTFGATYRVLEGLGDVYRHGVEHREIDPGELHGMLREKLERTTGVYVFSIFDADLNGVASGASHPIAMGRYRGVPLDALHEIGGGRLFGPLYQNQNEATGYAGEWSLPLAFAVHGKEGEALGYAVGLINSRFFSRHYEGIDVGAHGRIALWTADGRLVAGTPNIDIGTGTAGAAPMRAADGPPDAPSGAVFGGLLDSRAADRITVHIPVPDVPLSVSVSLDARDFMRDWRQARNQIGAAVAGVLLAMAAFTAILLRQLSYSQRNENALRQAKAAAEEANDAKSRFLAHMSHEFRTPLNAIMGFSEIIRSRMLGDGVSSTYTAYADHIHRSGEHLLNIVNDILDMAKIESGAQPLQQETVDIRASVAAAVSFVQGLATQRDLRISVNMLMTLPGVSGDARFIRQVLINLLSNAIKFSPPGGEILVWASCPPGRALDISVKDSGPGIEPTLLKRLGEPFLQGNPAVSHAGKGTGLGLSICKRYMDLLGGELAIESMVDVGTTATLRFPRELLVAETAHQA